MTSGSVIPEDQNANNRAESARFPRLMILLQYLKRGRRTNVMRKKLWSQFLAIRAELDYLEKQVKGIDGKTDWTDPVREHLKHAEEAFGNRDFETCMASFHRAERFLVYGLEALGQEELEIKAKILRQEAQEIDSSWQSQLIDDLLGEERDPSALQIVEAYRLIHEHRENKFETYTILSRRLRILIAMLLVNLAAILTVVYFSGGASLFFSPNAPPGRWELTIFATLFGFGGGLFYVLARTIEEAVSDTPEGDWLYESTWWAVLGRAVLGGFAGLTVLLLANSGVIANQIITGPLIVLLAFAFGLYVQKFLGVVETVTGIFDRNSSRQDETYRYRERR